MNSMDREILEPIPAGGGARNHQLRPGRLLQNVSGYQGSKLLIETYEPSCFPVELVHLTGS